ncbi:hypothetical protein DV738_g5002, partial [Chaetothyriales sp. CBS 135597]
MSAGTLYSWPESGNSYKVRLLAALLGLDLKIYDIDFLADEQHQPKFLSINPRGEVPTLVTADNKTLTDSSSILVYLAGTYAQSGRPGPSTFWSTDLYEQAQIIDWLAFSNSWVQFGVFTNRAILSYNGPYNALGSNDKWPKEKLDVLLEEGAIRGNKSLEILQTWLETHEWLVLNRPTIADVSVFVYIALAPMGDIALTPYPAVLAWIERIKKLPGFISIPGLDDPLPAILASPDLTLLAVYSRTLASAKTLVAEEKNDDHDDQNSKEITLYSDDSPASHSLDALLARADISAVTIALPITVQPAVIRRCLAAGKHVLSEKPIAPDVAAARAAAEIGARGQPQTFRVRIANFVALGGKYIETVWRKTPGYQGGFVLDGGVHNVAGLRLLLSESGEGREISEVSAFAAQLQPHLPPVDTVVATARTVGGAVGTISISFGTREEKASEYVVGSEKGWVAIRQFDRVVVDGKSEDVDADGGGVKREPEQALADLELVEAILKSAQEGGKVVKLQHQRVAI